MPTQTGSIDLKGYKDAAKAATAYITDIDSNHGITIKPLDSSGNDYLQLNSSDIRFIRNGYSRTILQDDWLCIGDGNGARITLSTSSDNPYIFMGDESNTQLFRASSSGVTVGNGSSGHATVKSNGLHVWTGAESTASNEIAVFGSTTRIGAPSAQRVTVASDGVNIYNSDNELRGFFGTSGFSTYRYVDGTRYNIANFDSTIRIGRSDKEHIAISDTALDIYDGSNKKRTSVSSSGLDIYDTDGTTSVASFSSTARVGKSGSYHINIGTSSVDICDSAGSIIKMLAETTNSLKQSYIRSSNTYSTTELAIYADSGSRYGQWALQSKATSGTYGLSYITGYFNDTSAEISLVAYGGSSANAARIQLVGGSNANISINKSTSIGGTLTIGGHDSAIGTRTSGNSSKSIASGSTLVALSSKISLTAGTWLLLGGVEFPANATGVRRAAWYDGGGSSYSASIIQVPTAGSGYNTRIETVCTVSVNSNIDMYIYCGQNSGSSLTVGYSYQVVRIA